MTINSLFTGIVSGIQSGEPVSAVTSSQRSVTSGSSGVSPRGPIISADSVQGAVEPLPEFIDVKVAVEKLNELAESQKKIVSYSVDSETQATVIRFYKSRTGELIKQYPQEEILALKAHIGKEAGWFIYSKK